MEGRQAKYILVDKGLVQSLAFQLSPSFSDKDVKKTELSLLSNKTSIYGIPLKFVYNLGSYIELVF